MTIKQQIKHGPLERYAQLHNGNFHPIHLRRTLLVLMISSPVLFPKITNFGMKENEIFCIYACFSVTCYIKGGRKRILGYKRIFQYTNMHKQPILTK